VLAVAIGLALGLAIGLQPFVRRSFFPIVLLLYGMPQVTILPLFILSSASSGIQDRLRRHPRSVPVIVTVVAGVQNLKPILLTGARSHGASRWQIFRTSSFPHGAELLRRHAAWHERRPARRAAGRALRVDRRIGYFTTLFTQNFDPAKLLGLIGVLAAIGDRAQCRRATR